MRISGYRPGCDRMQSHISSAWGRAAGGLLFTITSALATSLASAATIVVDSAASQPSSTSSILADAVAAANDNDPVNGCAAGDGGAADTIRFSASLSGATIAPGVPLELDDQELIIDGTDIDITISGNQSHQIFQLKRGTPLRRLRGLMLAMASWS